MGRAMANDIPEVDRRTLVGLALFLLPLLTMGHELGGHALVCVGLGHLPSELGAYYVQCPGTSGLDRRLVAMAGTGSDVILALFGGLLWWHARAALPRLAGWIVFAVKGMVAAGYWMFSGLTNLGDWGPAAGGGIGPLPWPWLWRVCLFLAGLAVYIGVVRQATRMLQGMLGGGEQARRMQRRIAMTVYLVGGALALLVGLFNPYGLVITLVSAMASSFGGTAGLFNVAYARAVDRPPQAYVIDRRIGLVVIGVLMSVLFAAVLGPTLYLHA